MREKEAQFNEEKNNMWKELTEAFQKVVIDQWAEQIAVMYACAISGWITCTLYFLLKYITILLFHEPALDMKSYNQRARSASCL